MEKTDEKVYCQLKLAGWTFQLKRVTESKEDETTHTFEVCFLRGEQEKRQ